MNTARILLTLSLLFNSTVIFSNYDLGLEPWGVDCELSRPIEKPVHSKQKKGILKKGCVACIHFFQDYISPIDGPRSTFYPTSSQYALEAIEKYGMFKGIALGCDRLMRENDEMWVYGLVDKHGHKRKYDPVR